MPQASEPIVSTSPGTHLHKVGGAALSAAARAQHLKGGANLFTFRVEVPVRAHVRKYLLHHNHWVEPVPVCRSSFPGMVLMNLLERNWDETPERVAMPDTALVFSLSERYAKYSGFHLTNDSVLLFNNVFDELFRQELEQRVEAGLAHGAQIKQMIYDFRAKYKLEEEDFTYDNFRKYIYRFRHTRKEKNRKKFLSGFVP